MNKEPLLQRLPTFIALPLVYCVGVPLFYVLGKWSEKVDGVEPKSGQQHYDHKTVDGQQYSRRAGLRHRLDKWKPVVNHFGNMDISSMYPHIFSKEIK